MTEAFSEVGLGTSAIGAFGLNTRASRLFGAYGVHTLDTEEKGFHKCFIDSL